MNCLSGSIWESQQIASLRWELLFYAGKKKQGQFPTHNKNLSLVGENAPTFANKNLPMATYNELTPANYYLIQENENAGLELVYIPMVTEKAVLVEYQDEDQTLKWYKKTEPLTEVVEQLTEEQAVIYESLFDDDDDEDDDGGFEWDEDDDDDDDFGWDDDGGDTKMRAINN